MSLSLFALLNRRFGTPPTDAQRREFLKMSAAAGAALMLSGASALARYRPSMGAKRIVVVGGGFSGLACAYELKAAGYDVSVIEARDRVGGRVLSFNAANKSEYIAGRNIEGGGELIGSNHPLWNAYAAPEKFNLPFIPLTENKDWEAPIIIEGKKLDAEESGKVWEDLDKSCNLMNKDAESINEDEPWKSNDAAALDKKTIADWLKKLDVSDLCRKAMAAQFAGDNGVANDKASYLCMLAAVKGGGLEKYWSESEVARCKGGNQSLALRFAKELGDRVTVGLAVRSVEQKNDKMMVECADGRTIECDDVVLAIPPSMWSRIELKPGLPAVLSGTGPQMGCNVKYLPQVKTRFWKDAKLDPMGLGDDDLTWTWDGTDSQEGGDENACLSSFSGGPAAERARSRKGEERDAAYAAGYELRYKGFKENFVKGRFMDWPADPWTKAGYSFAAPGQVTTVGPALRKGLGRVHFAGEHCCYKFVGYMEGALCSGVELAKRLAVRDGVAK